MEFPTAAAASAAGKSRPAKLHSMLMKLKIDQGWGFGDLGIYDLYKTVIFISV